MSHSIDEAWITLTADDGHRLDAFHAAPPGHCQGYVVVLQEIFGVNQHIRNVARSFAELGYHAVAPALFDRKEKRVEYTYDAAGIERGKGLLGAITLDTALRDVRAAVEAAPTNAPVFVVGFCWGGSLAWLAAATLPLRAAVAYYGGQIGALLDRTPNVPMLTHFGALDASIPASVPEAVSKRYPQVINHVYQAGHGFNCNERPSFHVESAELANRRTQGFLRAIC